METMPLIKAQPQDAGKRLDRFLTEHMEASRSHIQKLIKQEIITVNERPAQVKTILKPQDSVYYPEMEVAPLMKSGSAPLLDVLYEDDDLLLINKPAGLLVHEALKAECRATVVDALLERYPEIADVGDNPKRPGIVHRLDKDVSGVMVIAKTKKAFEHLKTQFQEKTVKKEYLALVYGSLPKDTDTIDLKIARSRQKGRMVARTASQEGKEAITQYEVLKRFTKATYARVRIFTGRTHQIRVHFQAIGHPIVGDTLYTRRRMKFKVIQLDRLFLHSHKLTIQLMNGRERTFVSPLPDGLVRVLQGLRTML